MSCPTSPMRITFFSETVMRQEGRTTNNNGGLQCCSYSYNSGEFIFQKRFSAALLRSVISHVRFSAFAIVVLFVCTAL